MTPFGERLRELRQERGIAQKDMARALGVSAAYLSALARMQSQCRPTPWAEIRAQLESALGEPFERVFADIDEVPLGSASLAQVHRARLLDGRAVAVKIQRPGIAEEVRQDLATLESIASGVDHTAAPLADDHNTLVVELAVE